MESDDHRHDAIEFTKPKQQTGCQREQKREKTQVKSNGSIAVMLLDPFNGPKCAHAPSLFLFFISLSLLFTLPLFHSSTLVHSSTLQHSTTLPLQPSCRPRSARVSFLPQQTPPTPQQPQVRKCAPESPVQVFHRLTCSCSFSVRCSMFDVLCSLFSVLCSLFSVQPKTPVLGNSGRPGNHFFCFPPCEGLLQLFD